MANRASGAAAAGFALALASCGGGGDSGATGSTGGSGGTGGVVTTPAPPTLAVTLTPGEQSLRGTDDASDVAFTMEATQATSTGDTVVPDLQYDRTQLTVPAGIEATGSGRYTIRARTAKGLATGTYSGTVTFRLCRDTGCNTVYAGSTQTARYTLTVGMRDWGGFQRNPAHDGQVRASFAPAAFRRLWEWAPTDVVSLSAVASYGATVFTTVRNTDGTSGIHALSSDDGTQRWLYNLGRVHSSSAPATGNGRVYVTTMTTSSTENLILSVDATTGEYRSPSMGFASQWSSFLPPVVMDQAVYMSAGYYGNVVYGFDLTSRTAWGSDGTGSIWDGETPAVDGENVYYYSGKAIEIFDRSTGERKQSLIDPFFQSSGYSYYGAPILGGLGNVLAYSGHRGQTTPSPLVSWSLAGGGVGWRSADVYATTPAVSGGMVYLARNQPARLDALRETSGAVAWSWTPPAGERFIGNTIATQTLVFASTDKAVYAIAIDDPAHPVRWSAPTPGELAITADARLIVAQWVTDASNGYVMPRKLVAYALR